MKYFVPVVVCKIARDDFKLKHFSSLLYSMIVAIATYSMIVPNLKSIIKLFTFIFKIQALSFNMMEDEDEDEEDNEEEQKPIVEPSNNSWRDTPEEPVSFNLSFLAN